MEPEYEHFDHTADMGLRVRAPSLAALIAPATEGLYAMIGELVPVADASLTDSTFYFETEHGPAFLLRDYLDGLLFQFERFHRVLTSPSVRRFDDRELFVSGTIRMIDADCSVFFREVKAITYHELAITPIDGGVEAAVIVDI